MKLYRNEWKYRLPEADLAVIESRIAAVMGLDSHSGQSGYYEIHSLYFDDYKDACAKENEAGVSRRFKYRIRYYGGARDGKVPEFLKLDTYMLVRLKKLLNRTVWAVTEQMKLGKFDTVKSEFIFDITEDNGSIKDNKNDIIHLIGRIDRIDEHKDDKCTYIKIVDYKTGKKDMSLSDLYYGLQMQLVIYLKAAMEAADETKLVIPAGVLYYNIADPVIEGKPDKNQIESEMLKSLKMSGIVNEDDPVIPLLDANFQTDTGELPAKVTSVVAPFGTDKDGKLKKASQAITTRDFDNIISYTQKNIANMGREIMDGRTEASPYRKNDTEGRTACDYCGYRDICRFDARIPGNNFRVLNKLSDDDVLNKMQQPEDNNK